MSGSLTRILENGDHPYRFYAAELLLKGNTVRLDETNLEGLSAYEDSMEKALLDPLKTSLNTCLSEVDGLTETVRSQTNTIKTTFPRIVIDKDAFEAFEV